MRAKSPRRWSPRQRKRRRAEALNVNRLAVPIERIAAGGDAIEIAFPHHEVEFAGLHHSFGEAEVTGIARNGLPAEIGVLDIGLLMQLVEIELVVG